MKILSCLLLFITCHAVGQISDTIPGYIHTGGTTVYIPGDSIRVELLSIRQRKVVVQQLQMGMHVLYVPETDREEGNSINQQTKIITYQIAMDDVITEEQNDKIKQAIDLIMFNSPGVPVVIDTVDSEDATYTGTWRVGQTTATGWYMNTISHSNVTNSTVSYKGTFSKIEIYGEKFTTHGIVAISIDDGPEVLVDLYSQTKILPALLHTFNVPKGEHEVKMRVTGTKNAASTGTFGLVDFYRITR